MIHTAETLQEAFHYLWPKEVSFLKELALSLPEDPVVVNIGAGAGTSALAFLESRPDLFLISIDITLQSSPFGCLVAEQQALDEAGFKRAVPYGLTRYVQYWGSSQVLGEVWNRLHSHQPAFRQVDMVFIDGGHSFQECRDDILSWVPNILPKGIIAVHDYKKAEVYRRNDYDPQTVPAQKPWPGVDKAVDQYLKDVYEEIGRQDTLVAFRI